MTLLEKYFKGWRFRSSTPSFDPGDEVSVFVNRYDEPEGVGVARIGDTSLYVEGTGPEHVERRVRVRVTEFDAANASGRGEFVETVGGSSYTG